MSKRVQLREYEPGRLPKVAKPSAGLQKLRALLSEIVELRRRRALLDEEVSALAIKLPASEQLTASIEIQRACPMDE